MNTTHYLLNQTLIVVDNEDTQRDDSHEEKPGTHFTRKSHFNNVPEAVRIPSNYPEAAPTKYLLWNAAVLVPMDQVYGEAPLTISPAPVFWKIAIPVKRESEAPSQSQPHPQPPAGQPPYGVSLSGRDEGVFRESVSLTTPSKHPNDDYLPFDSLDTSIDKTPARAHENGDQHSSGRITTELPSRSTDQSLYQVEEPSTPRHRQSKSSLNIQKNIQLDSHALNIADATEPRQSIRYHHSLLVLCFMNACIFIYFWAGDTWLEKRT
ncbi:hypothetical protein F5Y09DRAFT_272269 [Xylaria sp. FL1042]|nr:hypothetical protein F5Y09DRAFT_272269 [Xylaria sp. FL1042]